MFTNEFKYKYETNKQKGSQDFQGLSNKSSKNITKKMERMETAKK